MSGEFHFINESKVFPTCENCSLVNKVRLIMAQNPSGLASRQTLGIDFDSGVLRIKCRRLGIPIFGTDRIMMIIQNNRNSGSENMSMNQIHAKDVTKACPGRNSGKR